MEVKNLGDFESDFRCVMEDNFKITHKIRVRQPACPRITTSKPPDRPRLNLMHSV
jgi:hypothetical protein